MACQDDGCGSVVSSGNSPAFRRALWAVILINGGMAIVELVGGVVGQSAALHADALDFIGDTATYAISLAVLGASLRVRAGAALFKGISLGVLGLWVFGSTLYRVFVLHTPDPMVMGGIGIAAFIANVVSVILLLKFREGDSNIRSVWLCSRNDAIGNLAVVLAATGVFASNSGWPDLAIAGLMAVLFLSSAWSILRQATVEWQSTQVLTADSHGHAVPAAPSGGCCGAEEHKHG